MATWTQDSLRAWILAANPENVQHRAALSRALLFLYARQTADEQATGTTAHENGAGFSGVDAKFLTSVAQSVQTYGNMTRGQAPYVAKKLAKYTGQLLAMVNAETPQPATPAPVPTPGRGMTPGYPPLPSPEHDGEMANTYAHI
jgi:hypothetical protein